MSCVYNFTQPSAFIYNPAPAACCWEQSWRGEGRRTLARAQSVRSGGKIVNSNLYKHLILIGFCSLNYFISWPRLMIMGSAKEKANFQNGTGSTGIWNWTSSNECVCVLPLPGSQVMVSGICCIRDRGEDRRTRKSCLPPFSRGHLVHWALQCSCSCSYRNRCGASDVNRYPPCPAQWAQCSPEYSRHSADTQWSIT